MTKRTKPTRAELIEAGAALQEEARFGEYAYGKLPGALHGEAYRLTNYSEGYFDDICIAAQLAAEKAGLA